MTVMLLEWVFTSVFLILAVLALRAAFGRRVSARLRYGLWLVVLVRLLVPVQLFTSPLAGTWVVTETRTEHSAVGQPNPTAPVTAAPVGGNPGLPVEDVTPGDVLTPPVLPDPPEPPPAPDLSNPPQWVVMLGWGWLGGSCAAALAMLASNLRFARRLRRCRIPMECPGCPLPVYAAVGLPSPCLFGFLRPAVYVTPEAAADPVMLRHVTAHEYTHFRQGDHLWSFLRCAALAVHWWNPLVWLAVALSRRDGELACDEGALRRLGDGERAAYGSTLLALVTAKPGPGDLLCFATTMAGDKKSLKERITRIACAPRRWLWAAVAVVLVTALACLCAFGQKAEEGPDLGDSWARPEHFASWVEVENIPSEVYYTAGQVAGRAYDSFCQGLTQRDWGRGQPAEFDDYRIETLDGPLDGAAYGLEGVQVWRTVYTYHTTTPEWAKVLLAGGMTLSEDGWFRPISGDVYLIFQPDGADGLIFRCDTEINGLYVEDNPEEFWQVIANALEEGPAPDSTWQADLNRNGVPETLKVIGQGDRERLEVWEDGTQIWAEEAYYAHAGYNALFLCRRDGQDYLLRYNPTMYQGSCAYSYQVFTLKNNTETLMDEGSVDFDTNFYSGGQPLHGEFDPAAINAFMGKVNALLADSVQLINSDDELLATFRREGRLYDSLGWLRNWEPVFTYDEGKTLLENLVAYAEAMSGQFWTETPQVRTLDEYGSHMQLTYRDKVTDFHGFWDEGFQPDPGAQVLDLNGDGRDEIAFVLVTGHGTGALDEQLYLFDAETLERYDTTDDLTGRLYQLIQSTGDEDYFYLSAPGMERVAISKQAAQAENPDVPLADALELGNIIEYSIEDGRLFCHFGCDASGRCLNFCGEVRVALEMSQSGIVAASSFQYVPYASSGAVPAASELAHYQDVLLGLKGFTVYREEPPVMIGEVPGLFNDDPATEIQHFTAVDLTGDGKKEVLLYVCGTAGDMGGYLLLSDQGDLGVCGTVFDRRTDWSNRWFQDLKTDGTFVCTDSQGGNWWRSVSRLTPTAAGGWTLYSMAVYRTPQGKDFDLDSFTSYVERETTEREFEDVLAQQNLKQDAAWYALNPANIRSVLA